MSARPGLGVLPIVQETLFKRSVEPHVGSYDFMLKEGLARAIKNIEPVYITPPEDVNPEGKTVALSIQSFTLGGATFRDGKEMLPRDARLAGVTYAGTLTVEIQVDQSNIVAKTNEDGKKEYRVSRPRTQQLTYNLGRLPIMVRSEACGLSKRLNAIPKPVMKDEDGNQIKSKDDPNAAHVPLSHPESQKYGEAIRQTLLACGEEESEQGGYFIINGNEKVCRMIAMQKRNYPIAQTRGHYSQSGPNFSTHIITIRCVVDDETSQTNALHFLNNGDCTVRFRWRKQNYFLPAVLLLRAWRQTSDREIYQRIVQGDNDNTFVTDRVEGMLRAWRNGEMGSQANSREECLSHIGAIFRTAVDLPPFKTDYEVGTFFLNKVVFIHLDNDEAKFNLMIYMIRKLYGLASGECLSENLDSPSTQEALMPGHLFLQILKEKLEEFLAITKSMALKEIKTSKRPFDIWNMRDLTRAMDMSGSICQRIEMTLATGNLVSSSGLDMRQTAGFSIIADRLNHLRFLAHFRAIHRGQFFTTLRTTDVRKLQPDNWGFLCPVHTPDGAPCGLLNHMAAPATISTGLHEDLRARHAAIIKNLALFGLVQPSAFALSADYLSVILDGIMVGYVKADKADEMALAIRALKVQNGMMDPNSDVRLWMDATVGAFDVKTLDPINAMLPPLPAETKHRVPWDLEITLIKPGGRNFPGLFLWASPSRLRRPVFNVNFAMVESIGTFEQPYLYIECPPQNRRVQERMVQEMLDKQGREEESYGIGDPNAAAAMGGLLPVNSQFTHREIDPSNIFSEIGLLTPFSEFNQSPRNMYQCQMCKQTMGTPIHGYSARADNKLYRVLNIQTPLVRSVQQDLVDGYPHGCNAIVAVISYTGYDMEDAMIINKSSYERGWGTGYVYKAEFVDLVDESRPADGLLCYFDNCIPGTTENKALGQSATPDRKYEPSLDWDGLPVPGQILKQNDPWYVYFDDKTKQHVVVRYKYAEPVTIEDVLVVGIGRKVGDELPARQKVVFKLRYRRLPTRGDKFASRAGQKGVLAQLWPHIDMPFAESGISPDVIINPNAFPSRMTIGMLIESMAGKSGALHGMRQDCTAFGYSEKNTASSHFGAELLKAGYNYYGNELMYSGLTGEPFQADIYMGVVYYQRLRHMVGDKYQVRSTGQRNMLTRQPVKGRKRGGGIRFGEMERDSLLAHGVSHMLHDRLYNSSDRSVCHACKTCGSIVSALKVAPTSVVRERILKARKTGADPAASAGASKFLAQSDVARTLGVNSTVSDQPWCTLCESGDAIVVIEIPFVFRYLVAELTAMNVRISIDIK